MLKEMVLATIISLCLTIQIEAKPIRCMSNGHAPQWALNVLNNQGHGMNADVNGNDMTITSPEWKDFLCDKRSHTVTYSPVYSTFDINSTDFRLGEPRSLDPLLDQTWTSNMKNAATVHLTNTEPIHSDALATSGHSDAAGAPVNEIEITPVMVEAGMAEFYRWRSDEYGDAECAVRLIFRAMIAASGASQ
jgi:hypothetical protein